jgi:hypothetical protein
MQALVYRVTKHTIPGWIPFHEKEPRGIAYETDTHFVHVFGKDRGLWTISTGLTVTQPKSGSIRDWVGRTFGAVEVAETSLRDWPYGPWSLAPRTILLRRGYRADQLLPSCR